MRIRPASGRLDAARIEQCHQAGYWHDEIVTDLLAKNAEERPAAIAISMTQPTWNPVKGPKAVST